MKRIWQIEEQVVEDPSTRMRVEFSSVHSDELAAGNDAPSHDNVLCMRVWTTDRSRRATFLFTRNGQFIRSDVESMEMPAGEPAASPPDINALMDSGDARGNGLVQSASFE